MAALMYFSFFFGLYADSFFLATTFLATAFLAAGFFLATTFLATAFLTAGFLAAVFFVCFVVNFDFLSEFALVIKKNIIF